MSFDPAGRGKDKTVIVIWNGNVITNIYSQEKTDQDELFLFQISSGEARHTKFKHDRGLHWNRYGVIDRLRCHAFHGALPYSIKRTFKAGRERASNKVFI